MAAGNRNGNGQGTLVPELVPVPERKPVCFIFATPTRQYIFDPPQLDVTVAELNELIDLKLWGVMVILHQAPWQMMDNAYNNMSEGAKRHVRIVNQSPILVAKPGPGFLKGD